MDINDVEPGIQYIMVNIKNPIHNTRVFQYIRENTQLRVSDHAHYTKGCKIIIDLYSRTVYQIADRTVNYISRYGCKVREETITIDMNWLVGKRIVWSNLKDRSYKRGVSSAFLRREVKRI